MSYRKTTIEGFEVSLSSHNVCDMTDLGIVAHIDGEFIGHFSRNEDRASCSVAFAVQVFNQFFNASVENPCELGCGACDHYVNNICHFSASQECN